MLHNLLGYQVALDPNLSSICSKPDRRFRLRKPLLGRAVHFHGIHLL